MADRSRIVTGHYEAHRGGAIEGAGGGEGSVINEPFTVRARSCRLIVNDAGTGEPIGPREIRLLNNSGIGI